MRVIADHSRAAAFLISDGVQPSNEGRGYVLRRIMRRAIRHGSLLGLEEVFFFKVVDRVIELMGDAYPELRESRTFVLEVSRHEEECFRRTLNRGLKMIDEEIGEAEADRRQDHLRRGDLLPARHARLPVGPHADHRPRARLSTWT